MRIIYKIFGVITNVITGSVIVAVLFAAVTLFIPKLFSITPYMVLSGSMEPVIPTGSLVYISENETVQEGDIVAYEIGDVMPVVHRIVGHGDEGYVTQGDANNAPDMNEVTDAQILGKCVFTVPGAGYLLSSIRSHTIMIGSIVVPVIIPIVTGIMLLLNGVQYIIGLLISDNKQNE